MLKLGFTTVEIKVKIKILTVLSKKAVCSYAYLPTSS